MKYSSVFERPIHMQINKKNLTCRGGDPKSIFVKKIFHKKTSPISVTVQSFRMIVLIVYD